MYHTLNMSRPDNYQFNSRASYDHTTGKQKASDITQGNARRNEKISDNHHTITNPPNNQQTQHAYHTWRQPIYHPTARKDEMIARDRMRPPPPGGKSKKDALGSVAESWGPLETRPYGMFEIEADPPSRSTSPFRQQEQVEPRHPTRNEVKCAKEDALELARKGTPYQK